MGSEMCIRDSSVQCGMLSRMRRFLDSYRIIGPPKYINASTMLHQISRSGGDLHLGVRSHTTHSDRVSESTPAKDIQPCLLTPTTPALSSVTDVVASQHAATATTNASLYIAADHNAAKMSEFLCYLHSSISLRCLVLETSTREQRV